MSGLQVEAANYLNVYTFEKWAEKDVPAFQLGEMLQPTNLDCKEGKTQPPNHLTEADLITLMDKHGIGTDATIHEHIRTV